MASDLLSIGASGTRAARAALDVTAHNIANSATEGYVRRSLDVRELSGTGAIGREKDVSQWGVRVDGVARNADPFLQRQLRGSVSESQAAATQLSTLRAMEDNLANSGLFDAMIGLEAALKGLSANPADLALREQALAASGTVARAFNVAANRLDDLAGQTGEEADLRISEANHIGQELARINVQLARTAAGGAKSANLMDWRDALLERLSSVADTSVQLDESGAARVALGDMVDFVSGGTSRVLSSSADPSGGFAFAIDGEPVAIAGGELAGLDASGRSFEKRLTELDDMAVGLTRTLNEAQANGADFDGQPGQPWLSGTNARDLAPALPTGRDLALAPAGSPPGSTSGDNLAALRTAFASTGHVERVDAMVLSLSSEVASRSITSEALSAITTVDRARLTEQAGVDLNAEAMNLIRFQQTFQASSRAMQVASDIFDTMLGVGR